jgi:uroporphyrin-III C-methyltransferase/precorrin-2 dehydrogenase/sirohydrochlorin ferrochelatase
MKYLPLFLSVRDRPCLVVGGGNVAHRKVELLIAAGARVTLVAPRVRDDVRGLVEANGGRVLQREFRTDDVTGNLLVVAATNDDAINGAVYDACEQSGILINAVDDRARSSAIFPAIVDRDPVTIAISTGGHSPTLATRIRGWIESTLHPRIGALATFMSAARERVAAREPDAVARRELLREIVDSPIADAVYQGRLGDAEAMLSQRLAGSARVAAGFVSLVGAGPGDPDLLTLKALRCLQRADVILYDNLVGPGVLDLARRDARRSYVGRRGGLDPNRQESINRILVAEARAGHRVVRLKGGDPFVFGRGGEEIETLAEQGIAFEVVPGITAALGCAAYAGIPLTHRDHAQSVRFVTGHRRDGTVNLDWPELARPDQTLVFYMGLPALDQICERLRAHGLPDTTPAALIARGTLPDQMILTGTIATLTNVVSREEIHGPTIIIVGGVVALRGRLQR